jgi:glucokinase
VQRTCVIGVDLGGTNVRAGAYFEDGTEAGPKFSNPSNAQSGTAPILSAIVKTVTQAKDKAEGEVKQIGLAIPGFVDNSAGMVRWAPNFGETIDGVFRYWEEVPIRAPLERDLGLPVVMGNDANLAALGEYRFGTGKDSARCLVMLTVGTGIGGGVVLSPSSVLGAANGPLILLGGNEGGAELGHVVVLHNGLDAHTGSYGSLEAYCQRDAIVQRARHRLQRKRPSILMEMCENDVAKLTPLHLSLAAERGDELAIEVWSEVGEMLGVAIGSFINVFAPDVVAIGGQIAKAGEFLIGPAKKTARNVAIPALYDFARIVEAEQVEDAGMLGAAAVAIEATKWK